MAQSKSAKKRVERITEKLSRLSVSELDNLEKLLPTVGKNVVGVKEAAQMLDCSQDTIRRAVRAGSLKGFQINNMGTVKIPISEIKRFLNGKK